MWVRRLTRTGSRSSTSSLGGSEGTREASLPLYNSEKLPPVPFEQKLTSLRSGISRKGDIIIIIIIYLITAIEFPPGDSCR
jgi:hypothetical protein